MKKTWTWQTTDINASWSSQQQPQNATGLFCGNAQRCPSQLFFQCFPWSHWAGCLGNDHEHELQNFCLWLLRCRYTTKQGTIVTAPPQPQPRVHSGRLIPIFGAPNFLCLTSRIPRICCGMQWMWWSEGCVCWRYSNMSLTMCLYCRKFLCLYVYI